MNQALKDLKLLCSLPNSYRETVTLRQEQASNIAKALEEIEKNIVLARNAIETICPWLSASLSPMNGGSHVACKEYQEACDGMFAADELLKGN